MDFKQKYLKYKQKYLELKSQTAGVILVTRPDGSSIEIFDTLFYHETAQHWSLKEALKFSHISKDTKRFVAEMPWDFYKYSIPHNMPLIIFNRIFPNAVGINILRRQDITDADFIYLRFIEKLNMSACLQRTITDVAFTHLTNLTKLDMSFCNQPTITQQMREHLRQRIPNLIS